MMSSWLIRPAMLGWSSTTRIRGARRRGKRSPILNKKRLRPWRLSDASGPERGEMLRMKIVIQGPFDSTPFSPFRRGSGSVETVTLFVEVSDSHYDTSYFAKVTIIQTETDSVCHLSAQVYVANNVLVKPDVRKQL